ncbi:MAG: FtsW/RodA/SpoVE family cell cycle protein [Clostridia bacterium]|nr:FtsW/RodA/SpoVE family cell cycle protein [Clostridia bacterium]
MSNGNKSGAEVNSTERIKKIQKKATPSRRVLVQKVGGVDRPFLICIILLLCMGTVMVFSASYPYAKEYFDDSYRFARSQIIFALFGLLVMTVVAKLFDYHLIRRFSKIIMLVGILLLVGVLVAGSGAKGAQRWLQIGPI